MKSMFIGLTIVWLTTSSHLVSKDVQGGEAARHWNQFRGPGGDGIASADELPTQFDESHNVRWKTSIPGEGWSSPVIWENEIWLTTGSEEKQELRAVCVDLASGKITKDVKVFDMIERIVDPAYLHDSPHLNSVATPTSVVQQDRVFVSFGSQGIACLDRQTGNKVWERRDLRVYQPVRQGSSPIVDDKHLYVAFDGTDQQFLVALDKRTGATQWKTDRHVTTDWKTTLRDSGLKPKKGGGGKPGDNKKAFATAQLIDVDGQRQLIAPAAEATIAYDPDTGKELWRVLHPGGFNVAARPLYAHSMVYVFTSGLTGYLMGIRPDGQGDVTDSHIAWSITRGTPKIPSPVIVGDLMFLVTANGGIVRCLEAKTGDEVWKTRLGGDHWASPVFANGKLYFSSKQGDVFVIEPTRHAPQTITRNQLDARLIASPAVSGSSLVLRSTTHLYCIQSGFDRPHPKTNQDPTKQLVSEKTKATQSDASNQNNTNPLEPLGATLMAMVSDGAVSKRDALGLWRSAKSDSESPQKRTDFPTLRLKLDGLAKSGKLTQIQVSELWQTLPEASLETIPTQDDKDWDALYKRLLSNDPEIKAKVDRGQATKEDIIAWMKKNAGARNPAKGGKPNAKESKFSKGKRMTIRGSKPGSRPGSVNFYAIVIGRLRSKDIELGEMEVDVDYVISQHSELNQQLIGSRVKLIGVAGQFLDALLQIKRGESIKVRTGDYNPKTKQLGFGYKFQVLERTAPFNPDDFGVPPKAFRGFRGELTGKIIEAVGYEVLLEVDTVVPASDHRAEDPHSIQGKRIRIAGFYDQHADLFSQLHQGDRIRLGVRHRSPSSDSFEVTEKLVKIQK